MYARVLGMDGGDRLELESLTGLAMAVFAQRGSDSPVRASTGKSTGYSKLAGAALRKGRENGNASGPGSGEANFVESGFGRRS